MLTPPHHQNLHQAIGGWNTASHVRCRCEPTDGCPLRVRSGTEGESQPCESQPCAKLRMAAWVTTQELLSSSAHQKLTGNNWVVMILRACTKNRTQHHCCLH